MTTTKRRKFTLTHWLLVAIALFQCLNMVSFKPGYDVNSEWIPGDSVFSVHMSEATSKGWKPYAVVPEIKSGELGYRIFYTRPK